MNTVYTPTATRNRLFLLLVAIFLTSTQGTLPKKQQSQTIEKMDLQEFAFSSSEVIEGTSAVACQITGIVASNISACNNTGTQNYLDDTFTAEVKVTFNDPPTTETLDLRLTSTGALLAQVSVGALSSSTSHTFLSVNMTAGIYSIPINLTAEFFANPNCKLTNPNAGVNSQGEPKNAPAQCSVCPASSAYNASYPDCWPPEGTAITDCNDPFEYAPDPNYPERTPLKYVRTFVHVFHTEDPNNPNNYTIDDIDAIRGFFDGPYGINDFLGNLCPSPDDDSPDMTDSRFRLLNTGQPDVDVFFHRDNRGWATSFYECNECTCGHCGSCSTCCTDCGPHANSYLSNFSGMVNSYVTGGSNGNNFHPSLPQSYINNAQNNPDFRNAYHIFIARGRWRDCNKDGVMGPYPYGEDCYNFYPGAFTIPDNCTINGTPNPTPAAVVYGHYELYKRMTDPGYQSTVVAPLPDFVNQLGHGFVGELYHILSVDHIGPLRAHYNHEGEDDGCDDTPWESDYNILGCNFSGEPGTKCALTQCQLGRIHYMFEKENPAIQRFPEGPGPHIPVGEGSYSMNISCDINEPDIVIHNGESVKWNSDLKLRSNVVVEPGGKLYIYCRVGMPEGARITVQTGGRLFLYGEVYNSCADKRWEGVVVNGNSAQAQQGLPATNQGYFRLNTGSIIEGANTSIRVESGGMVIGTAAYIKNSGGMVFEPYSFPQKGWFYNCDFTCDGTIYDFGTDPFNHAELHAVNNVRFNLCDFSVANVPSGQLSNTTGIDADGSMFRVSGSTFRGFDTGIDADGQFGILQTLTVNNCTFSNNQTGIFTLGMQNFSVTNNIFEVGGANFQTNYPSGLMMDNCTGYTVEENTFYGTDHVAAGRLGIITEDSGDDANLIKGNIFDYLEWANLAQGDNRGDQQGLQYHCNENGDNPYDFYVPSDGFGQQGIHIKQGNGKATMNTFSHLGIHIDGDFHNEVGLIAYYYKENDPAHEPNPNTPLGTGGINKTDVPNENACPEDEIPCDFPCQYTPSEWQQTESEFYEARSGWQTEKASLLALVDGGATASLLTEINGVTSQNAGQVTQHLLNLSPWLSVQALTATINKKQVLTENATIQILNANPEGLREAAVRSLVQSSFSQTVANSILANAGTQTARTTKENLVGQYRATMLYKADRLIEDILKDTVQVDLPLLRTWLANKQSLEANYAIVNSYLSEGNFTTASQKLNEIPQSFTLDSEGLTEHRYFADLAELWEDVYTNGSTMANLDQAGVSTVQFIADNSDRRAGAIAQGIINNWYGGHYRVVPILPGGQGPQGLVAPTISNSVKPTAKYLTVFPNPARTSIYFHWNLPDGMENATITITDLQEKVLEVFEITGQKRKQEWSVERLEHSIYIYHVKLPDGSSQTSKLVIIK